MTRHTRYPAGTPRAASRVTSTGSGRTRIGFAEGATLPALVTGALLVGGVTQGFYVAAAGLLICILDGVLDAWVLLVEILR